MSDRVTKVLRYKRRYIESFSIKFLSQLIFFFLAALLNELDPSNAALDQPLPQSFLEVGLLKTSKLCCQTGDRFHHGGVLCLDGYFLEERCFVV